LTMAKTPAARTHLPRALERRLLKPYAGSMLGRVASGAVARALSVLLRKHPRAALHAVAAGFAAAGRIGWGEARTKASALLGRDPAEDGEEAKTNPAAVEPVEAGLAPQTPAGASDEMADEPGRNVLLEAARRDMEAGHPPDEAATSADFDEAAVPQATPAAFGAQRFTPATFPPELVEAARRKLEAELDEKEIEDARRLLEESQHVRRNKQPVARRG
jgi:hypothetical protein